MSGNYLVMSLSQHLAAPTNPKINKYNDMKAREREVEREASETRTNWGKEKKEW